MYSSGRRLSQETYTRVPLERVQYVKSGVFLSRVALTVIRDVLTIVDIHGGLVASVCTSMPNIMKQTLTERLVACFDNDPLTHCTTATEPPGRTFETLHFSWYNRHCTQVSTLAFCHAGGS